MIQGHLKAMGDYLSNAKSFAAMGDLKTAADNLIWLRDEIYDALNILGENGDDKSEE